MDDLPEAKVRRITWSRTVVTGPADKATVIVANSTYCWVWSARFHIPVIVESADGLAPEIAIEKAKQMVGCRSLAAFMEYS